MTNEVSAAAVVLGATEVMDRPTPSARVGARSRRVPSCSQPRPSRTSRTICDAPATGAGIHSGSGCPA